MGDGVALETASMVEVELLQCFPRKAGGPDAALPAVGSTGGHFALQTRGQELLVAPRFGAGTLGEALDGCTEGRRFGVPESDTPTPR
jgi:hypothetical protein